MLKHIIIWFEKHKKISFIFMLFILGLMWHFSSLPGGTVQIARFSWTPIVYHFGIFFSFAFFLLAIITKKENKKIKIILAILVSLIISILDEIHQYFVPFRDASINDILIDMMGVLSLVLIYSLIKNHRPILKSSAFFLGRR